MRNRKSIDALSIGAIVMAAGIAAFSLWSLPPSFDHDVYSEVGRVMAREALSMTPRPEGIVVIARDTQTYPQPAMDAAIKAIASEAKKAGLGITTKVISLEPLRPAEVPPGDFYEAIRRAKPGEVILSLLGPPVLQPEHRARVAQIKPKIIAFCAGNLPEHENLRGLYQGELLQAAIVNRTNAGVLPSGAEQFEKLYEVWRKDAVINGRESRKTL